MKTIVAMHLKGVDREVFSFERKPKRDIYVYLSNWFERPGHFSYHQSGERHLKVADSVREKTCVRLATAADFRGAELLGRGIVLRGQFDELRPLMPGKRHVTLDGDTAGFRDDAFSIDVWLVEPGKDSLVPDLSDAGPCARHLDKCGAPWLLFDFFQQRIFPQEIRFAFS